MIKKTLNLLLILATIIVGNTGCFYKNSTQATQEIVSTKLLTTITEQKPTITTMKVVTNTSVPTTYQPKTPASPKITYLSGIESDINYQEINVKNTDNLTEVYDVKFGLVKQIEFINNDWIAVALEHRTNTRYYEVVIWDLVNNKQITTYKGDSIVGKPNHLREISVDPTRSLILIRDSEKIIVWNFETGVIKPVSLSNGICDIAITELRPRYPQIAIGCRDSDQLNLYDYELQSIVYSFGGWYDDVEIQMNTDVFPTEILFYSDDGKYLVVSQHWLGFQVIEAETGNILFDNKEYLGTNTLVFNSQGNEILFTDQEKRIGILDVELRSWRLKPDFYLDETTDPFPIGGFYLNDEVAIFAGYKNQILFWDIEKKIILEAIEDFHLWYFKISSERDKLLVLTDNGYKLFAVPKID